MRRAPAGLTAVIFLLSAAAAPSADEIPRNAYLKHVPLSPPRLVRQTEASAAFRLCDIGADNTRPASARRAPPGTAMLEPAWHPASAS